MKINLNKRTLFAIGFMCLIIIFLFNSIIFENKTFGSPDSLSPKAIGIALNPSLVIADESTSALDVVVQRIVAQTLKNVQREMGVSMIMIGHDMGLMAQMVDRIAVMYAGRLVEIGRTEEIMRAPKHPYTRGLIASTPSVEYGDISTELYQIKGTMPRLDSLPNGCSFNPRCEKAIDKF